MIKRKKYMYEQMYTYIIVIDDHFFGNYFSLKGKLKREIIKCGNILKKEEENCYTYSPNCHIHLLLFG